MKNDREIFNRPFRAKDSRKPRHQKTKSYNVQNRPLPLSLPPCLQPGRRTRGIEKTQSPQIVDALLHKMPWKIIARKSKGGGGGKNKRKDTGVVLAYAVDSR